MRKLVLGIFLGIILTSAIAFWYAIGGGLPVATQSPPLPLEKYIAHKAIHAKVDPEAGKLSPIPADEANLLQGAKVYQAQCAVCHGDPKRPMTAIAAGMFPLPPQLFEPGEGSGKSPVGGIFWRVKYGIRMTGMPGYAGSLSETEMWQVSLLLRHAAEVSAAVREVLKAQP